MTNRIGAAFKGSPVFLGSTDRPLGGGVLGGFISKKQ
jgi:hypothetical protein